MRQRLWPISLLFSLAVTGPLWGQSSVFRGSYNPQQIINKPIEVPQSLAPLPGAKPTKFSFKNLFSKFRPGTAQPPANSPLSTKYKNSLQPKMPIIPNQNAAQTVVKP